MSGFDLVPVDGGDPIRVPAGETVLGRGPFLGVGDRRVSRHHALLRCEDGQLDLKPTHLNPCFVQTSAGDEPRPLQRGLWAPLHHGDLFSLLPGLFVYRVEALGGDAATPRNSQMIEEEEPAPPSAARSEFSKEAGEEAPSRRWTQGDSGHMETQQEAQQEAQQEVQQVASVAPSEPRKRVLPAWMMAAAVSASKRPSPSLKALSAKTRKPLASRASQAPPPPPDSSPQVDTLKKRRKCEEEDTPPTRPSGEQEVAAEGGADTTDRCLRDPQDRPSPPLGADAPRTCEESGGSGGVGAAESNGDTRTPGTTDGRTANTVGVRPPTVGGASAAATSQPKARTPCQYGRDCYRKNPLHFQECSHPGDPDYQEEQEEEEEQEKPECPYGSDCYRKNPLHRKEYNHTQRAAAPPTRRAAAKNYQDDEDCEDEYEDSFINDDSEDVDDDSDYVPQPDSDDGEREDVRRLQREAQSFLKRSK